MGFISGLWLVMLGVLGAASLIIARKPDARALIDKLSPYQGWVGAISALWGVWGVVSAALSVAWLAHAPVYWVTFLADSVLQFALGLLLGVGVLKTFIKAPVATEKMDRMLEKLAPHQGRLGVVAVFVGLWMIAAGFIWTVS